ncbi:DUF1641 domain-containing protein [Caldivirga sp. UBA161]|uniref:DUF1641 domain-containing protein n=1 Tax=Caldivirga sp. UBA161 TaxID=1915569 RepID=UPI0025BBEB51|nr:DUF1641 domain-containing protein [Caldivirga sp. UBA161]
MSDVNVNDAIQAILSALQQMSKSELNITLMEATQCILCSLYGVSSNVKHEVKPINGLGDILRALNDPYVRKGLGLIIELLRSMGKCLDAAEKVKGISGDSSCSINVPCYIIAHGVGRVNELGLGVNKDEE